MIFFLAQLAYDAGQHIGLIGSATQGATHSVDRRKQGARRGVLQPVTGIQHVTDEIYTETGPETGGVSTWIRWTNQASVGATGWENHAGNLVNSRTDR